MCVCVCMSSTTPPGILTQEIAVQKANTHPNSHKGQRTWFQNNFYFTSVKHHHQGRAAARLDPAPIVKKKKKKRHKINNRLSVRTSWASQLKKKENKNTPLIPKKPKRQELSGPNNISFKYHQEKKQFKLELRHWTN